MRTLFLAAWLLELGFTAVSWFWLPERVGDPGKTMDRSAFVLLMLALSAFVPWQCVDGAAWLVRRLPDSAINLPNKAYWLAPERREATLDQLRDAMTPLGLLLVALLGGQQLFTLQRSRADLFQLPDETWLAGAVVLALLLMVWVVTLHRRFALPKTPPPATEVSRQPRRPERRPRA